jgi:DNA-directed RNA polymerase specialized sigma24 family protein
MPLGQQLAPHLPFLRRYARALTGSQVSGDAYVRATLQSIVDSPADFPAVDPRLGLYHMFHVIWLSAREQLGVDHALASGAGAEAVARA